MTGGLLQLVQGSSGSKDNYLIGNPQISQFKIIYKRYANFAVENISVILEKNDLKKNEDTIIDLVIPRHADLISSMYFTFELPNVYSQYGFNNQNTEFHWIKNIGANIIKKIELFIDSNLIDTITGDWIKIYHEQNLSSEEKKNFDKLIGNIKEIYDPSNGNGQNGNYPYTDSKSTSLDQAKKYDINNLFNQTPINLSSTSINNLSEDLHIPSIKSRKIRVPLNFWFTKNSGLALPLIALQSSEVRIKITLRKYLDLYTIVETKNTSNFFNYRIKPNNNESHHNLDHFCLNNNFTNDSNLLINSSIDIDYIFLDNDERKRFATYNHEYLIERTNIPSNLEHLYNDNHDIKISSFSPIKYLTFALQRSDAEKRNDWNNYTNWIFEDIPPNSFQYNKIRHYGDSSTSNEFFFYTHKLPHNTNYIRNPNDLNLQTTYYLPSFIKKNILEKMTLKLNNLDRFKEIDNLYFQDLQNFSCFRNNVSDGIYTYSFSLNPKEFQPSGACDFSKINKATMELNINPPPLASSSEQRPYFFIIKLFIVEYNILKILGGMGRLAYVQ